MGTYTHQTAPTQFVDANGIRFAYRRFGKPNGVPLVFNQHYLGTMDYWDPMVTDGLARSREVILFDNAGDYLVGEGTRLKEWIRTLSGSGEAATDTSERGRS